MRHFSTWVFLTFFAVCLGSDVAYSAYPEFGRIITSCSSATTDAATWCDDSDDKDSCLCSNLNALATVVGCLDMYATIAAKTAPALSANCVYYNVTISEQNITEALARFKSSARNVSDIPDFNSSVPIDFPVLVEQDSYELYKASNDMYLGNYNDSLYYGSALLGYWLVVFLLAGIINWSEYLFPGMVKRATNKYSNFIRKHITIPAVHKKKNEAKPFLKYFGFLIPSRLQSLIMVGFLGLTVAMEANHIHYIKDDPAWNSRTEFMANMIASRSGILSALCTPLLILFAGRNNFLMWITRWDFATFLTYHRFVSRIVVILVVMHSVAYSVSFGTTYAENMREGYIVWGVIGTSCGGLLLIQGMQYLRNRWYETFLLIHIFLAVFFIVGAWNHVATLGYAAFYYAASAVWVFDRVVRIGRLVAFGFPKSKVVLAADETFKVIVPKPKWWKPIAGGYAYIHFMRPSCFWQSHPFTFTESTGTREEIILYVKVKGGVTHGLHQHLANLPGRIGEMRVAIEGPYGEPSDAKNYDSAIFLAGGNGIPGIYSEVVDLALRSKDKSNQVLKLIWIVREYKSLYWFYTELTALKHLRILPIVYVTRPDLNTFAQDIELRHSISVNDTGDSSNETGTEGTEFMETEKEKYVFDESDLGEKKQTVISTIKSELAHVEFREGRPELNQLIVDEIHESQGSTAFITCGHPQMVDEVRFCVANNLEESNGHRVEFLEKLQVWA